MRIFARIPKNFTMLLVFHIFLIFVSYEFTPFQPKIPKNLLIDVTISLQIMRGLTLFEFSI